MNKKLKKLWRHIKLAFIIKKVESKAINTPSIIPGVEQLNLRESQEKSVAWFTKENNLVNEFVGEAPIVFSSNFGTVIVGEDEIIRENTHTVKKQDQYDYVGEDKTNVEDEWIAEDVRNIALDGLTPIEKGNSTINLLNNRQLAEADWDEIKRELIEDSNVHINFEE